MTEFATKVATAFALGVPSVVRFAWYRLGVRTGLNPVRSLMARAPVGPFFGPVSVGPTQAVAAPVAAWRTSGMLFSRWSFPLQDAPPDWLANPLDGRSLDASRQWWQIPDFDPAVGDIKIIWELSRLDWALAFAQQARLGDSAALRRLNEWLADWCTRNPPYYGPNWKCGQEASIRIIHLAAAALILGQKGQPTTGIRDVLVTHLRRIEPTLQYAIAQNNNHGTSEAAALFIGGSWLSAAGVDGAAGWEAQGRRWLENRSRKLIGKDGTFSQYSLNYHRLMLDTLSFAEVWRRHRQLPAFSAQFDRQAGLATRWLEEMIDPTTGAGPNVGANDGARLLQLSQTAYDDCRPSVQLASALFLGQRAYAAEGPWNDTLRWLDVPVPQAVSAAPGPAFIADDGGFVVLRNSGAKVMMRYPRFRFRPSQADALHIDLWINGINVLRDGGSYSYNTDAAVQRYFSGTESHNTIQFDGHDQMPRLGRFLFGAWLKCSSTEAVSMNDEAVHFCAAYRDSWKASHRRSVSLGRHWLRVSDQVAGFSKAVLRWRLAPGQWRLDNLVVTNGSFTLRLACSSKIVRCALVEGWESRHYLDRTSLPVLEMELEGAGTVVSDMRWDAE